MASCNRESFRHIIFVGWKNDKSARQVHKELNIAYTNRAPSYSTVKRWFKSFNEGRENLKDNFRSGRPKEATTPQKILRTKNLIEQNPKSTIRYLADEIGISTYSTHKILHKELSVKKITAKWVPHVLSEENKKNRVQCAKELLELLNDGFDNVITGNETWIYFFTVSNKESNKVWIGKNEQRPTIVRTARNSKKRMFCMFFSIDGVLVRKVVPEKQTVNGSYYATKVLPEVFQKFKLIKGRKTMRNVKFHHDNAAPHKCKLVTNLLEQEKLVIMPHPPYSPDLAPCDFYLFPKIKKLLGGKRFDSIENLARAVQSIVDNIPKEEYIKTFENWQRRLKLCIDADGEYFEGLM